MVTFPLCFRDGHLPPPKVRWSPRKLESQEESATFWVWAFLLARRGLFHAPAPLGQDHVSDGLGPPSETGGLPASARFPANREFYPVTDGRGGGCPLREQQSSPFSWFTEGFPVPQGWGHTSFAHSRGR